MSNRIKIKIDLKAEKPKIIKQFNTSKCLSLIEHHKKWCDISSPFKQGRISEIEKKYGFTQVKGYRFPSALTNLIQLNVF